jgi:hypothetical protein
LVARGVGLLTVAIFIFAILEDHAGLAGTTAGIGIVVYILLRLTRPVLDPIIVWLLTRNAADEAPPD